MANGLAGDYDVVVEVNVRAVNRILATLHQKGVSSAASPKFLHSFVVRIGDEPKAPSFDLAEAFLNDSFGAVVDVTDIPVSALGAIQAGLVAAQQALGPVELEVSSVIDTPAAKGSVADSLANLARLAVVRGTARVQVGTPRLSLPPNSTSEIEVAAGVRAQYTPDPGTMSLPAPIHGEFHGVFSVEYTSVAGPTPLLNVKPSEDKTKIGFVPAPGSPLTSSQVAQLTREVGRAVRTKFRAMTAALPDDFAFPQFKSLVTPSVEAIALPVKLTGAPPASALDSVSNLFLDPGDDFAIGISKDYVDGVLQPALDQIEQLTFPPYKVEGPFGSTLATFHAWISKAGIQWKPDLLVLTVTGGAKLWVLFVGDKSYNFTFTQNLKLELENQTVVLKPVGDVSISGVPQLFKSQIKSKVKAHRDSAVQAAQSHIKNAFTGVQLNDMLQTFDASAQAQYSSLQVDVDGVILRGGLTGSTRPAVVVDVAEAANGAVLSAFKSWIPAGTVDQYVWSWVTRDPTAPAIPWGGKLNQIVDTDSFTLSGGAGGRRPWATHRVCLSVQGRQDDGSGDIVQAAGGGSCQVEKPEWLAVTPAWWEDVLMVPIWTPDPPWERLLNEAVVAHLNVRPETRTAADAATTAIIHFAADPAVAPLPLLSDALLRSRYADAAIPAIVVLPRGTFEASRAEVEARLGAFSAELASPLVVTEDYEGGWTEAFKASGVPQTFLLNPNGEVVWQETGPVNGAPLASALDEHAVAGRRRQAVLVRPRLRTGAVVPDIVLDGGQDGDLSLQRLRGQQVTLTFWTSWSAPCLKELRLLQRHHDEDRGQSTVVVAVGAGAGPEQVREIARQHNLRYHLVADPERRISRRFGVNCWPTTIRIDDAGRLHGVHVGETRAHPPRVESG